LNFGLEYLIRVQVLSRFIQNPSNYPTSSAGGLYLHKPQSFPQKNPVYKKYGNYTVHFMFGGRLLSRIFEEYQQPAIQNKIVVDFSSNKSVPASKKK
jgi:hypothetical protein